MQIFLILPFILYINIFASSYASTECILPPIKYRPAYIQADNTELKKWRELLSSASSDTEYENLLNANKNIICLEKMPDDISEYRRCFQYAIEKITGFNGFIDFPNKNRLCINLEKYFQQTPYPKENDLLIYTTDEKNLEIHHFAVAIDQIWFESKSGAFNQISRHLPFDLLEDYGDVVWSFEPREKYQGEEGQKILLQDMQLDLYNKRYAIAKHINIQNQEIRELRNQNKTNKMKFFCFGAIAGITYMVTLPVLIQRYKNSLS